MSRKAVRIVALCLLVLAAADLCEHILSDVQGPLPNLSDRITTSFQANDGVRIQPFSNDTPASGTAHEDDSFACCGHIIPSPLYALVFIPAISLATMRLPESRFFLDLSTYFHPPRS